jgi:hypothetical protein
VCLSFYVKENEKEISLYNLLFLLLGRKRPKRLEGRGFLHSLPSINGRGTTKVKHLTLNYPTFLGLTLSTWMFK